MINFYKLDRGKLIQIEKDKINDALWINLVNPSKREIDYIIDKYEIPRDYVTASLDEDEIARTENLFGDGDHKYLSFTYPLSYKSTSNLYETRLLSMVLVGGALITVSLDQLNLIDLIIKGDEIHFGSLSNNMDVLIEIVWQINKLFLTYLHEIKIEQERISDNLLKTTDSNTLINQANLIKSTIYFDYALEANAKVILQMEEIVKNKSEKWKEAIRALSVENKQALIRNKQEKEIIENLSDVNSSIISNNLNIVMKMMTAATIMLTIPTIISGIWGMNIEIPFMDHDRAFLIVTIITGLLVYLVYRLLKKKGFM